jgi:hypothetical protein
MTLREQFEKETGNFEKSICDQITRREYDQRYIEWLEVKITSDNNAEDHASGV